MTTFVPVSGPVFPGGPAYSAITKAIKGLYGIVTDVNEFIDKHIEKMKSSQNPTISRTGRVLEMAKLGFGIGYISSVTIIAVGQYLLGNTFAALGTLATAAMLSNPIAMTCAAIGAILYGWMALSDQERNDILVQLSSGLGVGIELIKSIISYVIDRTKELVDPKVAKDLGRFISEQAALFGRSLSDVTHLTVDMISDAGSVVRKHVNTAIDETRRVTILTTDKVGEVLTDAAKATGSTLDAAGDAVKRHTGTAIDESRRIASKTSDQIGEALADVAKSTGEAFEHTRDAASEAAKKAKILVQRKKDEPPAL